MTLFSQRGNYRNNKNSKEEENGNKQATVVLSNEAIYNFVLTLTNSPQIISTKANGNISEIKHFKLHLYLLVLHRISPYLLSVQ